MPLSQEAAEIYLFNCTNADALYTILSDVEGEFAATVHNFDLTPLSEASLSATIGSLLVDLGVPEGGFLL